jgi:hypothetical protein
MEIRGERTWCPDCTAPRIPPAQVPLITLFLDALPAWRPSGGMVPVLMEGFDRAELRALIHCRRRADLPVSRRQAYAVLLEMEADYRAIRHAQTPATPAASTPQARGTILS